MAVKRKQRKRSRPKKPMLQQFLQEDKETSESTGEMAASACDCDQPKLNEKVLKRLDNLERKVEVQSLLLRDVINMLSNEKPQLSSIDVEKLTAVICDLDLDRNEEQSVPVEENKVDGPSSYSSYEDDSEPKQQSSISNDDQVSAKCVDCGTVFPVSNGNYPQSYADHIQSEAHQFAVWKPLERVNPQVRNTDSLDSATISKIYLKLKTNEWCHVDRGVFKCFVCNESCSPEPLNLITHLVKKAHLQNAFAGKSREKRKEGCRDVYSLLNDCQIFLKSLDSENVFVEVNALRSNILEHLEKAKKSLFGNMSTFEMTEADCSLDGNATKARNGKLGKIPANEEIVDGANIKSKTLEKPVLNQEQDSNDELPAQARADDPVLNMLVSILCAPSWFRQKQLERSFVNFKMFQCVVCGVNFPASAVNCAEHLSSKNHLNKLCEGKNPPEKTKVLKEMRGRLSKCVVKLTTPDNSDIFSPQFKDVRSRIVTTFNRSVTFILNELALSNKPLKEAESTKVVTVMPVPNRSDVASNKKVYVHQQQKVVELPTDKDQTNRYSDHLNKIVHKSFKTNVEFNLTSNNAECLVCKTVCSNKPQDIISHIVGKVHLKNLCVRQKFKQKQKILREIHARFLDCEKKLKYIDLVKVNALKSTVVLQLLNSLSESKRLFKIQEQTLLGFPVKVNVGVNKTVNVGAGSIKDCNIANMVVSKDVNNQIVTESNVLLDENIDIELQCKMTDIFFDETNLFDVAKFRCIACSCDFSTMACPAMALLKHLVSFDHLILSCKDKPLSSKMKYVKKFCYQLENLCSGALMVKYMQRSKSEEHVRKLISYLEEEVSFLEDFEMLFWCDVSTKFDNVYHCESFQNRDTMSMIRYISEPSYLGQFTDGKIVNRLHLQFCKFRDSIAKFSSKLFNDEKAEIHRCLTNAIDNKKHEVCQFVTGSLTNQSKESYEAELKDGIFQGQSEIPPDAGCVLM